MSVDIEVRLPWRLLTVSSCYNDLSNRCAETMDESTSNQVTNYLWIITNTLGKATGNKWIAFLFV